ncbi:hypothetical protein [Nocardia sp. BMG51109]|uniref:hypothetical protein n=1 Tax=Nocardia sp. BMG51109 TaxID=1056816 RepID=UPI0004B403B8|nr:hypothetical protein [Nocardia sp. BMG51109]
MFDTRENVLVAAAGGVSDRRERHRRERRYAWATLVEMAVPDRRAGYPDPRRDGAGEQR